jgi:hypothetical protein
MARAWSRWTLAIAKPIAAEGSSLLFGGACLITIAILGSGCTSASASRAAPAKKTREQELIDAGWADLEREIAGNSTMGRRNELEGSVEPTQDESSEP